MSISSNSSTSPPTDRREQIVQSGLERFARTGYHGTSVKQLAKHAGVSQGLLYTYFDGKDGLLKEIFERIRRVVYASWQSEAQTLDRRLEDLVYNALRSVRDNENLFRLFYQLRMQPEVVAELAPHVDRWQREILGHLTDLCRDLNLDDPDAEARVLFAFVDGAAQQVLLTDTNAARLAETFLARFLGDDHGHSHR